MRQRVSGADAMLLLIISLWSLNFTVSRYILTHGFRPLAYSSTRYGIGALCVASLALVRERSLRIAPRDALVLVLPAAATLFANQYSFVYALKYASASAVALVLGATPIFVGILAWIFRLEKLPSAFWLSAVISFGGVALVAAGSGDVSGSLTGDVIAVGTAASWATYSLLIVPLMRRYSALRSSGVVMLTMAAMMFGAASTQLAKQSFQLGGLTWLSFVYSILGPIVVAQVLWFAAVERVGAGRASLFINLQPFIAVVFAILLLSETLARLEIAGGVLIAIGILFERRGRPVVVQQPPGD